MSGGDGAWGGEEAYYGPGGSAFGIYGNAGNCLFANNTIGFIYSGNGWWDIESPNILGGDAVCICIESGRNDRYLNNILFNTYNVWMYPEDITVGKSMGLIVKDSTGSVADYNCYYNHQSSNTEYINMGNSSFYDDPMFLTYYDDFHLAPYSPCINSGTTVPEVIDDFESEIRPSSSGFDIGAYEFTGYNFIDLFEISTTWHSVTDTQDMNTDYFVDKEDLLWLIKYWHWWE